LDLSWAANMGLADVIEGDGKGGWTDQGPDIDMRDLPTGRREFAGIPFKIVDPAKNDGRSVVVLAGRRRPTFPREAVLEAGDRRAAVLYFLHTCAWGGTAKDRTVAEYEVRYQDGEKAVIPLRVGVEFTNWWGIRKGDACEVGWSHERRGVRRGVNVYAWRNPRPDSPISTLVFRSRERMPVPILLAVTFSDEEETLSGSAEPVVAVSAEDWPVFEPKEADPTGTPLDVGAVLRASKTSQERWWGVSLPREFLKEDPASLMPALRRAAACGCNLLRVPFEGAAPSEGEMESLEGIAAVCRTLGIRVLPDPAIFLEGSALEVGMVDERPVAGDGGWTVDPIPCLMDPASSFVCRLASRRRFGSPYLALYSATFPGNSGAERPLLAAVVGAQQGWTACATLEGFGPEWGTLDPADPGTQPPWMSQFPAAALAFRRGDFREARVEWSCPKEGGCGLPALVHRSGWRPGDVRATDHPASPSTLVHEKTRKVVSETGQVTWQGNIGVAQVNSPRFQAVMGFLSHRRLKNAVWDVESPNEYAVLSAVSLTMEGLQRSRRILLSAGARAVNSGMTYSADRRRCLSAGKGPVRLEPVRATLVLHRLKPEPGMKAAALDASGRPLKRPPRMRWLNNDVYLTWPPEAAHIYLTVP
jgi:hypothetical protein